jgi:hypothetical protein
MQAHRRGPCTALRPHLLIELGAKSRGCSFCSSATLLSVSKLPNTQLKAMLEQYNEVQCLPASAVLEFQRRRHQVGSWRVLLLTLHPSFHVPLAAQRRQRRRPSAALHVPWCFFVQVAQKPEQTPVKSACAEASSLARCRPVKRIKRDTPLLSIAAQAHAFLGAPDRSHRLAPTAPVVKVRTNVRAHQTVHATCLLCSFQLSF